MIWLPNPTSQPPPASFMAGAMNANGGPPYGLSSENAAQLSTNGSCPGGARYCWALNWNVFGFGPSLAVYPGDFSPAPNTYSLQLEAGDVVDIAFVNPSPMVRMHAMPAACCPLACLRGQDPLLPFSYLAKLLASGPAARAGEQQMHSRASLGSMAGTLPLAL